MIRQAIAVGVTAAAATLTAGSSASAVPSISTFVPRTVECFRAPCPQLRPVVDTTAPNVFGPDGYRDRGWICRHATGRLWVCVQPRSQHRR